MDEKERRLDKNKFTTIEFLTGMEDSKKFYAELQDANDTVWKLVKKQLSRGKLKR